MSGHRAACRSRGGEPPVLADAEGNEACITTWQDRD